jgi:hypothetical protein
MDWIASLFSSSGWSFRSGAVAAELFDNQLNRAHAIAKAASRQSQSIAGGFD